MFAALEYRRFNPH